MRVFLDTPMAELSTLVRFLDTLLENHLYRDSSVNGLQIETKTTTVKRVAFAVDAAQSTFDEAVRRDCQLIVVHHGLIWGSLGPLVGSTGSKVNTLIRGGCSLYASHLPLDGNHEVGNGWEFARSLGLEDIQPFCELDGMHIGARGVLRRPLDLDAVVDKAIQVSRASSRLLLPFGPKKIGTVGIVTGSGSFAITSAANEKLDLLVSGEPKHSAYHTSKECGMNALFVGHYSSETFGVQALQKRLERDFELETTFIDDPSGI